MQQQQVPWTESMDAYVAQGVCDREQHLQPFTTHCCTLTTAATTHTGTRPHSAPKWSGEYQSVVEVYPLKREPQDRGSTRSSSPPPRPPFDNPG